MRANIPPETRGRFRILARAAERDTRFEVMSYCRGSLVSVYEWRCTGHDTGPPVDEYAEAFEVVVPRRGAFEWRIDGSRIVADPGSATFLPRCATYQVRHPVVGGDAGTVFRLAEATVRALLAADSALEGEGVPHPASLRLPLDGRAYLLHRLALEAARDPASDALEVEERALAFLRVAMHQAGRLRTGSRRPDRRCPAEEFVARVTAVVAARFRDPLTLGAIAEAVGVSPFHLTRVMTAATGVPIYRMVVRRRLREALELVLSTREGLARIALAVGFASQSHMTDAFRREYGIPPGALRRATSPRR
jgi:AraC-like DNA-binding protein